MHMKIAVGQKSFEHTFCGGHALNTQVLQTTTLLGAAYYLMHSPLLCLAAAF